MTAVRGEPNTGTSNGVRRFILFVADGEPNSQRAQRNLESLLTDVEDECEVRVSDVFKEFELAAAHNVLVTPCLVMLQPEPVAIVVGTMEDTDRVRSALRLLER